MLITKSDNVLKLPDSYKKTVDSNNNKLLLLNELLIKDIKNDLKDIYFSLDFFKATGKNLDLYGDIYNQKRGQMNDEQYRYVILSKIWRNMGNTDYNSILEFIVSIFNCEYSDVCLQDTNINDEACIVKLVKMPFAILDKTGFITKQVKQIIETLFPICVRLKADNFEGTFELAELDNEYDNLKGFGNTEQTLGGFFGILFGEDEYMSTETST